MKTVTYEMDDACIKEMLWGCIDADLPEPKHHKAEVTALVEQIKVVSVYRANADSKTVFTLEVPEECGLTTELRGDVQRTVKGG